MTSARHRRGVASTIATVVAAGLIASAAEAQVTFTSLADQSLEEVVAAAGEADRLVMLVITQPDWCPPCIRLDRDLLRNPDAGEIRELTRDWAVVEIHGYDEDGDRLLRDQGIQFSGTPTTLVVRPAPGGGRLRAGTLLGSIVGYPEDYVAQLRRAAGGHDPLAAAEAEARTRDLPADWMALGDLYVARGQAQLAKRAYQRILGLEADDLPGIDADSLAVLQRQARWANITRGYQRVAKDHKTALHLLDDFAAMYPDAESDAKFQYVRAWSLMADGREERALEHLREHFLPPASLEQLEDFLYLAFRHPLPDIMDLAVVEAERGLETYPDAEASLRESLARVLRRQGKTRQAEAEFERALALTDPADARYPIIEAQLHFVRTL